jgi:hypothetical protein
MASFLATAIGLAFTLVVCLLVLRALLEPFLRARRPSAAPAGNFGQKQTARTAPARGAAPIHSA